MKQALVFTTVLVGIVGFSAASLRGQTRAHASFPGTTETPLCTKGTLEERDDCVLDPSDCTRGIDESNQEECS